MRQYWTRVKESIIIYIKIEEKVPQVCENNNNNEKPSALVLMTVGKQDAWLC